MVRPKLGVSAYQMNSTDRVKDNLEAICESIIESCPESELLCFPENSLYFDLSDYPYKDHICFDISSPELGQISRIAKEKKKTVHLGSIPFRGGGNVYNSSILIDSNGTILEVYRKIHLFDVDIPGFKKIRESSKFAKGEDPKVEKILDWTTGMSVCFDLRFSDLFYNYAKIGAELLLVPSAFLVKTGKAHWEVLLRARAIECQAWVVAPAQWGTHMSLDGWSKKTFGH